MIESFFPGLSALQNIHPMFVHFPIAFFLGALAMEGIAVLWHERFHFVATWMLYPGTFAAIVTLSTGFMAANSIAATDPRDHAAPGHDFIHVHRNWMVAVTLLGIALSIYVFWINHKGRWASQRWGLLAGLILLSGLLTLGADRGARLVFEFGTGVNPDVLKTAPEGSDRGHDH